VVLKGSNRKDVIAFCSKDSRGAGINLGKESFKVLVLVDDNEADVQGALTEARSR
jgi:hypothetical protein